MMRFLGNNVAKICRLQNRNISSASKTAVTATIDDAPKCLCRAVVCGIGYMIGWLGISSSAPASKFLQETEEAQLRIKRLLDKHEAGFEAPMK